MGQYHIPVCLGRKEFLYPHALSSGLKQWEQFASSVSTPAAIFALLCTSNHRGGGDLAGLGYQEDKKKGVLGRWAGQPIAVIGDYSEEGDLEKGQDLSDLYRYCSALAFREGPSFGDDPGKAAWAKWKKTWGVWKDITPLVRPVLAENFGIEFTISPSGSAHYVRKTSASWSILDD